MVFRPIIHFAAGDFVFIIVLIIIVINVLSSIVKKFTGGDQNTPGSSSPGQGPGRKKTFVQLIEEVRKMAEGEGPGQHPPQTGQQNVFNQPHREMQLGQTVRTPRTPALKPVGQIRQPTPIGRNRKTESIRRLVMSEEEMRIKAAREEAEKKARALREHTRLAREKEERRKKAGHERKLQDKARSRFDEIGQRYKTSAPSMPATRISEETDYSRIFQSPGGVRDAIILREILGPPRASRRYNAKKH